MEILSGPEVKELNERTVAYLSFVGNYMGNTGVFEDLFSKLCSWAGPRQLFGPDTVFLSAYYDDPGVTPPGELRLEVCMSIADDVEVESDIKKQTLPGGKYVVMRVELAGPEEYVVAWEKPYEWMLQNGLELDMDRASYEIYLNSPDEHPENHHIVELNIPILG